MELTLSFSGFIFNLLHISWKQLSLYILNKSIFQRRKITVFPFFKLIFIHRYHFTMNNEGSENKISRKCVREIHLYLRYGEINQILNSVKVASDCSSWWAWTGIWKYSHHWCSTLDWTEYSSSFWTASTCSRESGCSETSSVRETSKMRSTKPWTSWPDHPICHNCPNISM